MVMPIARSGYARLPVSWTGRDAEMVRCSVASALPVMSRLSWGADRHDHDLSVPGSRLDVTLHRPRANRVYLLSWHFRRAQGCVRTGCCCVRPSTGLQTTVLATMHPTFASKACRGAYGVCGDARLRAGSAAS